MAFAYRSSTSAGNASGGALSINKPTGTASGDLLVAVLYLESDTNTFSSVPAGWQLAGSQANTGLFKIWVYYLWAGGSEPASYSWTPTTNAWRTWTMAAYSGGGGSGTQPDVANGSQGDGVVIATDQTAPSITPSTDHDLLIFSYGNFSGTNVGSTSGKATNLRISFGGTTIADFLDVSPAAATGTSSPSSGVGTQDYAAMHLAFFLSPAGPPSYDQSSFRFRNDDGSESGASWRQSEGVDDSAALEEALRLRIQIDVTNDAPSAAYSLQYKRAADPDSEFRTI